MTMRTHYPDSPTPRAFEEIGTYERPWGFSLEGSIVSWRESKEAGVVGKIWRDQSGKLIRSKILQGLAGHVMSLSQEHWKPIGCRGSRRYRQVCVSARCWRLLLVWKGDKVKKHIQKAQDDWNGSRLIGGGDADNRVNCKDIWVK